jgi:hypothetical protein
MARLAQSFQAKLGRPNPSPQEEETRSPESYDDSKYISMVIDRYCQNRRLIQAAARAHHVWATFIWEPTPVYKYDLKYHLFRPKSYLSHTYPQFGYPAMARIIKEQPKEYAPDFLWLADIQEHSTGPLYVDETHYTGALCKEIAQRIGQFLLDKKPEYVSALPQVKP